MATVLTAKEITATYGELALVEAPAIDLFAALGWSTANLYTETFGKDGNEGRLSESEVILVRRLRTVLERLNPDLFWFSLAERILLLRLSEDVIKIFQQFIEAVKFPFNLWIKRIFRRIKIRQTV